MTVIGAADLIACTASAMACRWICPLSWLGLTLPYGDGQAESANTTAMLIRQMYGRTAFASYDSESCWHQTITRPPFCAEPSFPDQPEPQVPTP